MADPTQGPWFCEIKKVDGDFSDASNIQIKSGPKHVIADVYNSSYEPPHDWVTNDTDRANGCLLAAAPEMLATIKALAEVVQCLSTSKDATYLPIDRILGLAESVIGKATDQT